jgi:hypothetical protein
MKAPRQHRNDSSDQKQQRSGLKIEVHVFPRGSRSIAQPSCHANINDARYRGDQQTAL